jgi:protein SCO1/2
MPLNNWRFKVMKRVSYLLATLLLSISTPYIAYGAEEMDMDMDMHNHHHNMEMHDHHHVMPTEVKRSEVNINLPKVQLVKPDGKEVSLQNELNDGRVVVLSFIYTTCTAICPMTSQTIYKLQGKLGGDLDKVHLMSISIDPEQDTPEKLAKYADKYHASKFWDHYTGTESASISVQKAMNVYHGDKMNHTPVTFIWSGKGESWVRIDGFASADDILLEVRRLIAKH